MGQFSPSVPIKEWLFGGNTSKRLEDTDKCNKVMTRQCHLLLDKEGGAAEACIDPSDAEAMAEIKTAMGKGFKPNFCYGSS